MIGPQTKSGPGGAGNTVIPGLTPAKEGLMPQYTHIHVQTATRWAVN